MSRTMYYDAESKQVFPVADEPITEPYRFTNADRIRTMSDEELCDEYFRILNHQLGNYTDSRLGLLEWLKKEAKHEA